MKIMLLDPSLRFFGVVVVETTTKEILEMSVIQTLPNSKLTEAESIILRTREILGKLTNLIKALKPDKIVFENPQGSQSSKALLALATVRTLCVSLEYTSGIKPEYVEARAIKKLLGIPRTIKNTEEVKEKVFQKVLESFPDFEQILEKYKVKSKQVKYTFSDCLGVYLAYNKNYD